MGLIEKRGLDINQIKALYEEHRNIKTLANMIGCNEKTIRNYFKKHNFKPYRGKKGLDKGTLGILPHKYHSKVACFLRDHPKMVFPKSPSAILRTIKQTDPNTEITIKDVNNYLENRVRKVKNLFKQVIKSNPDVLTVTSGDGKSIFPYESLEEVKWKIHKWTLDLVGTAISPNGERTEITSSYEDLQKLVKYLNDLHQQEPTSSEEKHYNNLRNLSIRSHQK